MDKNNESANTAGKRTCFLASVICDIVWTFDIYFNVISEYF